MFWTVNYTLATASIHPPHVQDLQTNNVQLVQMEGRRPRKKSALICKVNPEQDSNLCEMFALLQLCIGL